MFANVLGRLDPKTGEFKEYPVKTPASGPHGLAFDTGGSLWFTANSKGYDPDTLVIKEYELPHPESRPRRIAISPDDIIWYADYSRGYLGRLSPTTGEVTEWPSPSGPTSQPYGITYLKGAIWYVESAIKPNVLVRFDIPTRQFQSWIIPGGGGVVRNIKATSDGQIVMAESGVNKIALVTVTNVGRRQ
jgi:virginiamycin B lyase